MICSVKKVWNKNLKEADSLETKFKDLKNYSFSTDIASYVNKLKAITKVLGDYLTTKTPLKNAYKFNSSAFKPQEGMVYRGIGEEGLEDALQTGYFNSPKKDILTTYWADYTNFVAAKNHSNPIIELEASKWIKSRFGWNIVGGKWRDGKSIIAEFPKEDDLFKIEYKGNSPDNLRCDVKLPIKKGKIYIQNWIRGYKKIKISHSFLNLN